MTRPTTATAGAPGRPSARDLALRLAIGLERRWDRARLARRVGRPPTDLRIAAHLGHGGADRVVLRARVLDDPEPAAAVEGEGVLAAIRRTIARFTTDELPGVALRLRVGAIDVEAVSDAEGYVELRLDRGVPTDAGPWVVGEVDLARPHRGWTSPAATPIRVRVPGPGAAFGVISDVDDTIMHTGAQRVWEMVRRTLTGSELTRTPLAGAPELYRALAAGDANPVFYVSSSPWNLHDFLTAFLTRRQFPLGPLLLRDLLGDDVTRSHAATKHAAIAEVLDTHPDLPFVLIGDSGQHDPEIYAEVVRRHPHRILAVYIREVRLDPGDGRVEAVSDAWDHDVPFLLAADSGVVAEDAAARGLITVTDAAAVRRAVDHQA